MSKKIAINEEDVEEPLDESRDDIVQHVTHLPDSPPVTAAPEPVQEQKAESKTRTTQLYKCDYCGKYLTKKSLNYSHRRSCPGRPENQVKPEAKKQEPPPPPEPEPVEEYVPPVQEYVPPVQQYSPQLPTMELLRMERRRQHLAKINRLTQFIA